MTVRFIQRFMARNQSFLRSQTERLPASRAQEKHIDKRVSFHLGSMKRGFESGLFDEDNMENVDETHFTFNMDNGNTLGFRRDVVIKYADVVSGRDPINMMVRLSGGRGGMIQPPMLIFKNFNCTYHICGVADDVPGIWHRTGRKGWMHRTVLHQWLAEPREIATLSTRNQRVLYVDNFSGHNVSEAVASYTGRIGSYTNYDDEVSSQCHAFSPDS